MVEFVNALEALNVKRSNPRLTTGDADLDSLVGGGVEPGQFYLFCGDEESGVDRIVHNLLVNALLPPEKFGLGGKSVYVNCGNYRYERTMLDTNLLCYLSKAAKLDPVEALDSIYSICVFSEEQEEKAFNEIQRLIHGDKEIKLVVVHNIAKLFTAKEGTPKKNSGERTIRLQKVVHEIRQICAENNLAFAASCRPLQKKPSHGIPPPEGGRYLTHKATVIVYLKRKSAGYLSAYLVKHPNRADRKVDLKFGGDELGRVTTPFRTLLKEEMDNLKRTYREVLIDEGRREAFDSLIQTWSSEQGAMSYARVPTALDIMLLTAAVDNRRLIEGLTDEVGAIRSKLDKIEGKLEKLENTG